MVTLQEASSAFIATLNDPRRRGHLSTNSQRIYKHYAQTAASFFGALPITDVKNGRVKAYVETLRSKNLSPSSITAHITCLNSVLRSVRNVDGELVCSQVLDREYLNVPIVIPTEQVCATREEIETALALGNVLVPFLAASGLRASEALALEVNGEGDSYDPATGEVHVRKTLKTASAARTVLLPEAFRVWLNSRIPQTGRLFPFSYQQIHAMLNDLGLPNCHSYRRFRVSQLRKARVSEDVIQSQIGHSKRTMTDLYSSAGADMEFVKKEIEGAALGFALPKKFIGVSSTIDALLEVRA